MARLLLRKQHLGATLLAAQCMETDTAMLLTVRERIQDRLQELIPPKDSESIASLVHLGIWAAPLLMKALPNQGPDATRNILWALAEIDFAPAIPVIARCATDTRPSGAFFSGPRNQRWEASIGALAVFILGVKIDSTGIARTALRDVLEKLPLYEVENLLTNFRENLIEEAARITREHLKRRGALGASA